MGVRQALPWIANPVEYCSGNLFRKNLEQDLDTLQWRIHDFQ